VTYNPIAEHRKPLTADSVQFLFVDFQPGIVENSKTNPPNDVVRAAVTLARLAKLFRAPIHLSVVAMSDTPPRIVPELAAETAGVPLLARTIIPAFDDEPTRKAIAATGRHDLVVCGLLTEVAVLLACFGAIRNGYEVHVPMDACGGLSERTEQAACRRIESFDANTAATATLGAVLAQELSSEIGKSMMAILQDLMR
jgi:nicotinamidase-related amidase